MTTSSEPGNSAQSPGSDRWRRLEPKVYAFLAGALTLWIAHLFVSSLKLQLAYADARWGPGVPPLQWSAPLDDVFIHFDFARSIAFGAPFEWIPGNGYSSGGTSLLYPFVLAAGYLAGFVDERLMLWATMVGATCVFACLLGSRVLFHRLPIWTSYRAPLFLLSVGALDWTLFSGMEVAFFLAVWALNLTAWHRLTTTLETHPEQSPLLNATILGLAGAIMIATRPEAAVIVAVFGLWGAVKIARHQGMRPALASVLLAGVPGALVLVGHALANHHFTGESSAAGALAKLELHHPYLSRTDVWNAWKHFSLYQIFRITDYHLTDMPRPGGVNISVGWLMWAPAFGALFSSRTRRPAIILWLSALLWIAVTALNGQVRWQNERYTMPAVAWLLLCSALGTGSLLSWAYESVRAETGRRRLGAVFAATAVVGGLGFWLLHQAPKFQGQMWFYGRASRNIRDQHMMAARHLRSLTPKPRRVLLGDAGAIPYVSYLPALDIIGLGGYHDLPFARATRLGVPGAVELIQRMGPRERPDVMALYPSWWGTLPLWFGSRMFGVDVRGNVICGGATKVVYQTDWRALDRGLVPSELTDAEELRDELDFADLLSEKAHHTTFGKYPSHLNMKILRVSPTAREEIWDGGRSTLAGDGASFQLGGVQAGRDAKIWLRIAPSQAGKLELRRAGADAMVREFPAGDQWRELSFVIPQAQLESLSQVSIVPIKRSLVLYHLWLTQEK